MNKEKMIFCKEKDFIGTPRYGIYLTTSHEKFTTAKGIPLVWEWVVNRSDSQLFRRILWINVSKEPIESEYRPAGYYFL
jgi:hypothetical protein